MAGGSSNDAMLAIIQFGLLSPEKPMGERITLEAIQQREGCIYYCVLETKTYTSCPYRLHFHANCPMV